MNRIDLDIGVFKKCCSICKVSSKNNFYTGSDRYSFNTNSGLNRSRLRRFVKENGVYSTEDFMGVR